MPGRRRRKRKQPRWYKPAAVLVGLSVLVGLELVARLMPEPPVETKGLKMGPHPTRIWQLVSLEPDTQEFYQYRLTDDGFRQPADPGPDDAPLILTTGDSAVFGDGVDDGETLHDQMRSMLAEQGVQARVATLAVPGYSTLQTQIVLEEDGWDKQPDLLVIANLWSDSMLDTNADQELLDALRHPMFRLEYALGHSKLFRLLRGAYNRAQGRPSATKVSWPTPAMSGVRRVPIDQYTRTLEALMDEARQRECGVVVLGLTNNVLVREGLTPEQPCYPYLLVQRQVAQARGVPYIDALDFYRASGLTIRQLFRDSLHPTATGDRVLAAGVVQALLDAGWPSRAHIPDDSAPIVVPADPFMDQEVPNNGRSVFIEMLPEG